MTYFQRVVCSWMLLCFIIDTVHRTVYTTLYSLHPTVFLTARKLVADGIVSVVDTLVSVSPRRIIVERRARQVLEDKDARSPFLRTFYFADMFDFRLRYFRGYSTRCIINFNITPLHRYDIGKKTWREEKYFVSQKIYRYLYINFVIII